LSGLGLILDGRASTAAQGDSNRTGDDDGANDEAFDNSLPGAGLRLFVVAEAGVAKV